MDEINKLSPFSYGRIYFQQPSPNHIIIEVSKLNLQASSFIKSCTNSPSPLLSSSTSQYYPESAQEQQVERLEFLQKSRSSS
jgi:hypothetical protein